MGRGSGPGDRASDDSMPSLRFLAASVCLPGGAPCTWATVYVRRLLTGNRRHSLNSTPRRLEGAAWQLLIINPRRKL